MSNHSLRWWGDALSLFLHQSGVLQKRGDHYIKIHFMFPKNCIYKNVPQKPYYKENTIENYNHLNILHNLRLVCMCLCMSLIHNFKLVCMCFAVCVCMCVTLTLTLTTLSLSGWIKTEVYEMGAMFLYQIFPSNFFIIKTRLVCK